MAHWLLTLTPWLLLVQGLSLLVFQRAYFPSKVPMEGFSTAAGAGDDDNALPAPVFDRMVFMVIDALRADFMLGEKTPCDYVRQSLQGKDALGFVAIAQIPTVTMPRIKVSPHCLSAPS